MVPDFRGLPFPVFFVDDDEKPSRRRRGSGGTNVYCGLPPRAYRVLARVAHSRSDSFTDCFGWRNPAVGLPPRRRFVVIHRFHGYFSRVLSVAVEGGSRGSRFAQRGIFQT